MNSSLSKIECSAGAAVDVADEADVAILRAAVCDMFLLSLGVLSLLVEVEDAV